MNGIERLFHSMGIETEETKVKMQSVVLSLKSTKRPRISEREVSNDVKLSQQGSSFERKIKHEVWRNLVAHIEGGNYTQAQLTQRLQIYQPDVSDLLRGKFSKFSTDKLIRYADKLNLQVQFRISTDKITSREKELEHA